MNITPVQSSRLAGVGYDEDNNILRIQFPANSKSPEGSIYDYFDVPPETYASLIGAESIGVAFGKLIIGSDRNNPNFKFQRVELGQPKQESSTSPKIIEAKVQKAQATTPAQGEQSVALAVDANTQVIINRAQQMKEQVSSLIRMEGVKVSLALTTVASYEAAANLFVSLKQAAKDDLDLVKASDMPAYQQYKKDLEIEKQVKANYDGALDLLNRAIVQYKKDEEVARLTSERAENARRQAVLDAAAEEQRKVNAEQAERDAQQLEAGGQTQLAELIRSTPAPVVAQQAAPVVYVKETPKVDGMSTRTKWKTRIDDPGSVPLFFKDRIQAVLAPLLAAPTVKATPEAFAKIAISLGIMFQELYTLDETKINGILKPKKELGVGYIPGITAYPDTKVGTTGR